MGSILGSGNPLEQEMETYSSILAWKIPWTKEPGGLQSTGHQELDTTEHTHTRWKTEVGSDGEQLGILHQARCKFDGKAQSSTLEHQMELHMAPQAPPLGTTALKLERLSTGQNQALNVDQS